MSKSEKQEEEEGEFLKGAILPLCVSPPFHAPICVCVCVRELTSGPGFLGGGGCLLRGGFGWNEGVGGGGGLDGPLMLLLSRGWQLGRLVGRLDAFAIRPCNQKRGGGGGRGDTFFKGREKGGRKFEARKKTFSPLSLVWHARNMEGVTRAGGGWKEGAGGENERKWVLEEKKEEKRRRGLLALVGGEEKTLGRGR